MKQFIVLLAVLLVQKEASAQQPVPKEVISGYYQLSKALVDGSVSEAAAAAGSLGRYLGMVDYKTVSEGNLHTLVKDASAIAEAGGLEAQRARFENLSANFLSLARNLRLSESPVYVVYCPMKKAYWLSGKSEVLNPYYGQSMLHCGSVTDSLNH